MKTAISARRVISVGAVYDQPGCSFALPVSSTLLSGQNAFRSGFDVSMTTRDVMVMVEYLGFAPLSRRSRLCSRSRDAQTHFAGGVHFHLCVHFGVDHNASAHVMESACQYSIARDAMLA